MFKNDIGLIKIDLQGIECHDPIQGGESSLQSQVFELVVHTNEPFCQDLDSIPGLEVFGDTLKRGLETRCSLGLINMPALVNFKQLDITEHHASTSKNACMLELIPG